MTGRRLPGAFLASDVRWDPASRTVRQPVLRSGQPPLYLLDGQNGRLAVSRAAYTREQLKVVPAGESDLAAEPFDDYRLPRTEAKAEALVENLHPFYSWLKATTSAEGGGSGPFAQLYNDFISTRGQNQRAWIEVSFAELRKAFSAKGWIHPTDNIPESERSPLDDEPTDEVDEPVEAVDELAAVAPQPTTVAPQPEDNDFSTLLAEILSEEPAAPEPSPEPSAIDNHEYSDLMAEILADLNCSRPGPMAALLHAMAQP